MPQVTKPATVNYSSLLSSVSDIGAEGTDQKLDVKKVLGQITSIGSFLNTLADDDAVNGMDSSGEESIASDSDGPDKADKGANGTRSHNGTNTGNDNKNKDRNSNDEGNNSGKASTYETTKNEREQQEKKREEEKKKRIQVNF